MSLVQTTSPARGLHHDQTTRLPWPIPTVSKSLGPLVFLVLSSNIFGLCVLPHPGLRVVTNKTSPTLLLAKPVSQPTHQHRPLGYFQSERGQISPRVLTL